MRMEGVVAARSDGPPSASPVVLEAPEALASSCLTSASAGASAV